MLYEANYFTHTNTNTSCFMRQTTSFILSGSACAQAGRVAQLSSFSLTHTLHNPNMHNTVVFPDQDRFLSQNRHSHLLQ